MRSFDINLYGMKISPTDRGQAFPWFYPHGRSISGWRYSCRLTNRQCVLSPCSNRLFTFCFLSCYASSCTCLSLLIFSSQNATGDMWEQCWHLGVYEASLKSQWSQSSCILCKLLSQNLLVCMIRYFSEALQHESHGPTQWKKTKHPAVVINWSPQSSRPTTAQWRADENANWIWCFRNLVFSTSEARSILISLTWSSLNFAIANMFRFMQRNIYFRIAKCINSHEGYIS